MRRRMPRGRMPVAVLIQCRPFCAAAVLSATLLTPLLPFSSGLEALWRNAITDVVKVLKENHQDNFRVWNLSEKETAEDLVRRITILIKTRLSFIYPL